MNLQLGAPQPLTAAHRTDEFEYAAPEQREALRACENIPYSAKSARQPGASCSKTVAQDGMRVRARAGAASFRREDRILLRRMAQMHVDMRLAAHESSPTDVRSASRRMQLPTRN
ncbi:hypothetical protein E4Q08_06325 [Candidatus Accumulibacter phosphatis]|uniref:Uncharacterized protein n=1 Tax=Candidatus Accumulibacter contiguus TaxID=2954381 RepID=A0ABX1T9J6_9PROT|nr:hypothetical protein [Candidatus Accumulibacter contiguus]